MTDKQWAPEPWKVDIYDNCHSCDGEHADILDVNEKLITAGCPLDDSDTAKRIVACVNACASVPTKWLESLTDGEIKSFIEEHITEEDSDAQEQTR